MATDAHSHSPDHEEVVPHNDRRTALRTDLRIRQVSLGSVGEETFRPITKHYVANSKFAAAECRSSAFSRGSARRMFPSPLLALTVTDLPFIFGAQNICQITVAPRHMLGVLGTLMTAVGRPVDPLVMASRLNCKPVLVFGRRYIICCSGM